MKTSMLKVMTAALQTALPRSARGYYLAGVALWTAGEVVGFPIASTIVLSLIQLITFNTSDAVSESSPSGSQGSLVAGNHLSNLVV